MEFFKRVEVWFLLAIAIGIALWAVFFQGGRDDVSDTIDDSAATQAPLILHRTTLDRDYGNARLDIELRYRNASPRSLILQPPDVRLLTGAGSEVPPYILPMEKPPQIPPQTAQDVRLRYWLEKTHLQDSLTLEIRGEKVEVKAAGAFDLDKLENRKPQVWKGTIGTP